jgi:hypothetical protein
VYFSELAHVKLQGRILNVCSHFRSSEITMLLLLMAKNFEGEVTLNDRLPILTFTEVAWLVQKLIADTMHMYTHLYVQIWLSIKLEEQMK